MNLNPITRGDDVKWRLTITAAGTPLDITGYTIYFTARVSPPLTSVTDDDDAIIHKVVTVHTTPTSGETEVELSDTDTNVDPGVYFYDIAYLDTEGRKKTMVKGKLTIEADETRT